ncbi:MAG: Hpt domain-containing protein [Bacteriovoracia bacterium]
MEELVKAYLKDLPEKVDELEHLIESAIHDFSQHEHASLKNLEHFTHTLAGSSGTYGFYSLSAACAFLETQILNGVFETVSSDQAIKYLRLWLATFLKHYQCIQRTKKPEKKGVAKTVEKELEEITSYLGELSSVKKAV